jgi:hypothetical protein
MSGVAQGKVALRLGEREVAVEAVLDWCRRHQACGWLEQAGRSFQLRALAGAYGITVGEADVTKARVAFCLREDIYDGADLRRWLARSRLQPEELALRIEDEALELAALRRLPQEKVEVRFALRRSSWDEVELSAIWVEAESAGAELFLQIREGRDFYALARAHSEDDETRPASGYWGWHSREGLPGTVAGPVFASEAGEVVGPLAGPHGYGVFKVEAFRPATFDACEEQARRELLDLELEARFPLSVSL